MNQQEMTIRSEAERLFREKFGAAGWSAEDFASFNGYCIEQAVVRIAAGGEAAAMQEILGAHSGAGAIPRVAADGTVTHPLLDRCLEVIREARAAAGGGEGIDAIAQGRRYLADGSVPVPDGDLITAAMWHLATEGVTPRLERLALAGALVAMEIDRMEALRRA